MLTSMYVVLPQFYYGKEALNYSSVQPNEIPQPYHRRPKLPKDLIQPQRCWIP